MCLGDHDPANEAPPPVNDYQKQVASAVLLTRRRPMFPEAASPVERCAEYPRGLSNATPARLEAPLFQPSQRHPSALYLLCLVECCERFAASAMLSVFALYLTHHRRFSDGTAILVSGGFLAGSYISSWPGGWLVDVSLGARRTAWLGLGLLTMGYLILWADIPWLFWPGLALAFVGQGFFRAALTTLIGRLYAPSDARREAGFGLLYISVNLGYLTGPLVAEAARQDRGWPAVFGVGALALVLALALYLLRDAGTASYVARLDSRAGVQIHPRVEKARIRALGLLSAVAVVFWLAIQQTGTSLVFFAEHHTVRRVSLLGHTIEIAPGHFATLHGALVLCFTPLIIVGLARLRRRSLAPSTSLQFVWGMVATSLTFAVVSIASLVGGQDGRVHMLWLVSGYLLLSVAEVLWGALGLAFMTQLAPARVAARMAGIWYASVAAGHLLAGLLGPLWQRWPHHRYFAGIAALAFLAAAVLRLRLRSLEAAISQHS